MSLSTAVAPQNIRAAGSTVSNTPTQTGNVSIPATVSQKLMLYAFFTIGSLTNVTLTPQVSYDGTNWYDVTAPAALVISATGRKAYVVDCCGAKLFRVNYVSTGTVTGSDLQLDVGFQKS